MLSIDGKYAHYPVVGISYNQAKAYCKWRSERVNTKYTQYLTEYKLPSKEQWELIHASLKEHSIETSLYPYPKNPHRLNGLCDNVSEMTDTEGIAMGNNWTNMISDKVGNFFINYESPKNWLGFRCIAYTRKK